MPRQLSDQSVRLRLRSLYDCAVIRARDDDQDFNCLERFGIASASPGGGGRWDYRLTDKGRTIAAATFRPQADAA